jgi:hypothetical protein
MRFTAFARNSKKPPSGGFFYRVENTRESV